MVSIKTCVIPVDSRKCGTSKDSCLTCPYKEKCDYSWLEHLWSKAVDDAKDDFLLSPCIPIMLKSQIRQNHIITVTGEKDFCMFNVSYKWGNKCDYVVISDIYVADELRGQKVATKLLTYLMEKYDRDIFAKCVAGTSAEEFWSHIGKQIDANPDLPDGHSLYEQRPGKRDLGWYVVENKNKKQNKVELF